MKKTLTLTPSYATTNTVRFDEVVEAAPVDPTDFLAAAPRTVGALGTPHNLYLTSEQINALGWKPTSIGEVYVAEGARGKTYNRRDVAGPSLKLTIETL
jgi:hypothetical protein